MAKDTKKLAEAFAVKDEIEGFLANLEKLKADGTITQEQYTTTSENYYERLGEAASEIARIKNDLKKQLEANQREMEMYRSELSKIEVKYKVGELPLEKYQASEKKLRIRLEQLEQYSEELTRLIQASMAADIGVTVKKPRAAAAPELLPVTKAAAPAKEIKRPKAEVPKAKPPEMPSLARVAPSAEGLLTPRTKLVAMAGGALLLLSIFLPWASPSQALGEVGAEFGAISGMNFDVTMAALAIIGGLAVIGTAFLLAPRARGMVQIIMGVLALLILLAVVLTGILPLLSENARAMMVIREGFYLYVIATVVLIVTGSLGRKHR